MDDAREHPASPLREQGRDEQVLADTLAVEGQSTHRLGDPVDALTFQRVARGTTPQPERRQEQAYLVDLTGVEERPSRVRAALEQDGPPPGRGELLERGFDSSRLVAAGGDDD